MQSPFCIQLMKIGSWLFSQYSLYSFMYIFISVCRVFFVPNPSLFSFCFFLSRPVDCVRGFSRETLVELTTNIESQEHRRRINCELGYAEHPRAGVTDDLETLFAMFHRYLGPVLTLKQFKEMWPKIVRYPFLWSNCLLSSSLPHLGRDKIALDCNENRNDVSS